MKNFFIAAGKSILWNVTSIAISLLQIIALFLFSGIFHFRTDYNKIIRDGAFLFFCSSFVVSTVFEYYSINKRAPKIFEGLYFVAIPLIMMFLIAVLYTGSITITNVDMETLKSANIIVVSISILYSLIYRTIKFYAWS